MPLLFTLWAAPFAQMDRFSLQRNPDGTADVGLTTTGLHPTLVSLKTKLFVGFGAPLQRVPEVEIEEVQRAIIGKRYNVRAKLVPLFQRGN